MKNCTKNVPTMYLQLKFELILTYNKLKEL